MGTTLAPRSTSTEIRAPGESWFASEAASLAALAFEPRLLPPVAAVFTPMGFVGYIVVAAVLWGDTFGTAFMGLETLSMKEERIGILACYQTIGDQPVEQLGQAEPMLGDGFAGLIFHSRTIARKPVGTARQPRLHGLGRGFLPLFTVDRESA